jgi:D-beta-D-heptose 7-phosphate kinase/D-beta-D-heptose 1-phosphate adenosyltransferase
MAKIISKCRECNKAYTTYDVGYNAFCSVGCAADYQSWGPEDESAICDACGNQSNNFEVVNSPTIAGVVVCQRCIDKSKLIKEKDNMNNPKPVPTPYTTVCVSGGFDPIHVGHVRMIQDASEYGNVIVILNSDEWLMRKKGYVFMPYEERREILESIARVHSVCSVDDSDGTVCTALVDINPNYFANGGDRKQDNTPEVTLCDVHGIVSLWNIGGDKVQSSSRLTNNISSEHIIEDADKEVI